MENTAFEQMLASELASLSPEPKPTVYDVKADSIEQLAAQKRENIYGAPKQRTIQSLEDGDSGIFSDNTGFRQQGLDTYETFHPGDLESTEMQENGKTRGQSTRARLERQKDRYSLEFATPRDDVTDQDIYEQGAKQGLQNLNRMAAKDTDKPWEPGDTSYYRTNPLELGSQENPLNVDVTAGTGPQDAFGRVLARIQNEESGQSVNDQGLTGYNAAIYNNRGRFDPRATERENTRVTAPVGMSELDQWLNQDTGDGFNNDGRVLTGGKLAFKGLARIVTDFTDYGVEKIVDNALPDGVGSPETRKFVKDLFNTDDEYWDKRLGVNTSYMTEANNEIAGLVEDGKYFDAFKSGLSNADLYLAQSAPEMLALIAAAPTVAMLGARVHKQSLEFEKSKGRKPTSWEEAGMWVSNAAVMLPEKLLLLGPMKAIMKGLAGKAARQTLGKGTSRILDAGKVIGKAGAKTTAVAVLEGTQEVFDQGQEQFWNKGGADSISEIFDKVTSGEVISFNEGTTAFLIGSALGGGIKGTAETIALPGNLSRGTKKVTVDKTIRKMSETLDDIDKDFISEDNRIMNANAEEKVKDIRKVKTILDNAVESKNDTLTELEKSEHPVIQGLMKKMKTQSVIANYDTATDEAKTTVETALTEAINTAIEESDKLGPAIKNRIDPSGKMSPEEFATATEEFVKTKDGRERIMKNIGEFINTDIVSSQYDTLSKDIRKADRESATNKAVNQAAVKESEAKTIEDSTVTPTAVVKAITEKKNTEELSSDKAVHTQGDLSGRKGVGGKTKDAVSWMFGSKSKKARAELSKFTTESLEEAVESADTETKALIKKIIKDRTKAISFSGIDNEGLDAKGEYAEVLPSLSLGKDKKVVVDALRGILKRSHFKKEIEVEATQALIDQALDDKHLTEAQREILSKRLEKLRQRTKLQLKIDEKKKTTKTEETKETEEKTKTETKKKTKETKKSEAKKDETEDPAKNSENDAESNPEEAEVLEVSNETLELLQEHKELKAFTQEDLDRMTDEQLQMLKDAGVINC